MDLFTSYTPKDDDGLPYIPETALGYLEDYVETYIKMKIFENAAVGKLLIQIVGKQPGGSSVHTVLQGQQFRGGFANKEVGDICLFLRQQEAVFLQEFDLVFHIHRRDPQFIGDLSHRLGGVAYTITDVLR